MNNLITYSLLFLLGLPTSQGAVYDTLPAGINTLVAKHISTTKIESRYGADKQSSGLNIKQEFSSSNLKDLNEALNSYFQELRALSPDAYNQFSLGEFRANAWAEISAQGYGIGHGVTDRLTVFASIPVYHVKTHVDFAQTKKSNLAAIQRQVENAPASSATANFIRELTMQLPDASEQIPQLFQSLLVKSYGYKPLGHFERDALGDAEIGMIYRLTNFSDKGQAIGLGAVLPTGKMDDPDSLQDISTGDGQPDAYIESLSGVSFLDNTLLFDLKLRYTYQFERQKELRIISNPNYPLSSEKRKVMEKLGDKLDATVSATINPTIWLNFNTSLIVNKVEATRYKITEANIKTAMESGTDSLATWSKIGVGFSGIELYKRKKLDIPFEVNLSYQRIMSAKNSPNYERIDADFRLYF